MRNFGTPTVALLTLAMVALGCKPGTLVSHDPSEAPRADGGTVAPGADGVMPDPDMGGAKRDTGSQTSDSRVPAADTRAPMADATIPTPDTSTPKADASPSATAFAFLAVGDTRTYPNIAQQNFQSMARLDPGAIAVFNSGDLTADGASSQWKAHVDAVNLGSAGKVRFDLQDWSPSAIRYFGVVGNHDVHDGSWLSNWNDNLSGQRNLGQNGSGGIYFATRYQNALFIVLDSQHPSSAQTSWLETTLKDAAADASIKWKFAFYHHPVYPCNYKSPWGTGIPWVRLFESYGVDVVFNGHAHVYERTCPMVRGSCQAGGVIYVISGGGGAETRDVDPTRTASSGGDSYDCSETLDAAKGNWHHYCRIAIDGGALRYACYSHDATTNPDDTFTINK